MVEPGAWVAFANGTSATFQATPAPGSVFVGWTSGCNSTATTCTISPADNADVLLNTGFEPSP